MKVRCTNCTKENNKYCSIKKTTISPSKKRSCSFFDLDPSKIKIPQKLPSTKRPEWYWDRKGYKKQLKEQIKAEQKRQELADTPTYLQKSNSHPVTGDLSRFITTATKEEG